ncbi:MAG: hypothetical protein ACE5EM_12485 [Sphingomonadales bacterium]
MANGILVQPLTWSAITASQAMAAGFPETNLGDEQPRMFAESATAVLSVDIDLGTAQAVDLIALLYTNADATATWEVRAADTQAELGAGTVFASGSFCAGGGVSKADRPHGFDFGAALTKRWWRITLTNSAAPARAGRLILGQALQPAWNFELSSRFARVGGADGLGTDGGALVPVKRKTRRRVSIRWGDLTDAEYYDQLAAIEQAAADGEPILFIRDPDAAAANRHQGIVYGLLKFSQGADRVRSNQWRAAAVIEEMT